MMHKIPRIGVAVIIVKDNRVLLGKRKNSHGEGSWAFPGGHLEWNESIASCAKRETLEETGMNIKNICFETFTNDIFQQEGKHYVTLFVRAEHNSGEPEVKEPHKCEQWSWFEWNKLPEPRFLPLQHLLQQGFSIAP